MTQVFRMTGPRPSPAPANQACSGGSGGFPPGSKKRPSLFLHLSALRRSLSLSLSPMHSLLLLPFPWLLFSRTLLTRQADPPYPAGGRRILLTYRPGAGGYSLLGSRILLTRESDTPYSGGGYSLLGRRILPTREADSGFLFFSALVVVLVSPGAP